MAKKPLLSELTLREKIGQTIQMQSGFLMNMGDKMEEYLKENPIGNVWHTCNTAMTTVNLADIEIDAPADSTYYREWAKRYREALRIPPILTNDAPGAAHATDLVSLTSVPAVGANGSEEVAYEFGRLTALNGRALGLNNVWSPNVDLPNRFSSVSLMRQFASDPEKLVKLSLAMMRGGQDSGFAMCAKHFPGKDKKEYRDDHFADQIIRDSLEDWLEGQGKVFQQMIDGGVWSIMPSHTGFPAVDSRRINGLFMPTTLSDRILTKLLKEDMHFDGVVVTDGIGMGVLKTAYPNKEDLYVALLNAGNDILLNVKDFDYIDMIERAVNDGRVSMERIDDAARRVIDMKEKMGLFEDVQPEVVMTEEIRQEIREFNRKVAEKALVLQRNDKGLIPVDPKKVKNVAIICSSHHAPFFDWLNHMKEEFERRGINVRLQRRLETYEEIKEIDEQNDLIIYANYAMPHQPMGGSGLYCEECGTYFFALSHGKEKSIGVSMGVPYIYYDYCINMENYAFTFSVSRESQIAFVQALFGEIPFEGQYNYETPWDEYDELEKKYADKK